MPRVRSGGSRSCACRIMRRRRAQLASSARARVFPSGSLRRAMAFHVKQRPPTRQLGLQRVGSFHVKRGPKERSRVALDRAASAMPDCATHGRVTSFFERRTSVMQRPDSAALQAVARSRDDASGVAQSWTVRTTPLECELRVGGPERLPAAAFGHRPAGKRRRGPDRR